MPEVAGNRLLLCGDLHADGVCAQQVASVAEAHRCDTVLQVGDLGWWPREADGRAFIECLERTALTWVFVEGNRDDLDALARVAASHRPRLGDSCLDVDPSGLWGPQEPVEVAAGVWWAARGARWNWAGRTFGALGGAWSPGWHFRVRGVSWFANETVRRRDLVALGDSPLDVLVCHDAPLGALGDSSRSARSPYARPGDEHIGTANAAMVARAACATEPQLLVHGHWHHRHSTWWRANDELSSARAGSWSGCQVEGMGANQRPGCAVLLNLTTLRVEPVELDAPGEADTPG